MKLSNLVNVVVNCRLRGWKVISIPWVSRPANVSDSCQWNHSTMWVISAGICENIWPLSFYRRYSCIRHIQTSAGLCACAGVCGIMHAHVWECVKKIDRKMTKTKSATNIFIQFYCLRPSWESLSPVKKTSSMAMILVSWIRFSSSGISFGGIM